MAEALGNWSRQSSDLPDSLRNLLGVGGILRTPSGPSISRYEVHAPALRLSEHVLRGAGDPRGGWSGLHNELQACWTAQHKVLEHARLGPLPKAKPSRLSQSVCRHLGICLCSRPKLAAFRTALISWLKPYLKKTKPPNPWKSMFESAQIVLRFDWFAEDDDEHHDVSKETLWFHLAHINQKSWALGLVRLHPDTDLHHACSARGAGHVALRAAPVFCDSLDDGDPFEAWGVGASPAVFEHVPLDMRCFCSVFTLAVSQRHVDEFIPAHVEVAQARGPTLVCSPVPVPPLVPAEEGDGVESGGEDELEPLMDGDPAAEAQDDLWAAYMAELAELDQEEDEPSAAAEAAPTLPFCPFSTGSCGMVVVHCQLRRRMLIPTDCTVALNLFCFLSRAVWVLVMVRNHTLRESAVVQ